MNRILVLTVISLVLMVGCSSEPINEESLLERGGLKYESNSTKPYSGKVFDLWDNGSEKLEGSYKKGGREGLWIFWYDNGQKMSEGNYKGGNKDGLWSDWYDNGKEKSIETYQDGKENGKFTNWYENGQKKSEITYKDGMVYVAGGTFQMGSNSGDSDEKPVHTVTVSSFFMDKTEVTQAEYRKVMGKNPSRFSGCDDCPVEQVSWHDANEYAKKVGKRLPTEAEWEYAARGGNKSKGYTYSGSNDIDAVGWYDRNSNSKTHPVGWKQPNELGLYDMSGNVWEWCSDWYGDYSSSPQNNPQGPSSGSYRVLRGGYWYGARRGGDYWRVADRDRYGPDSRSGDNGFRLVLSQDSK